MNTTPIECVNNIYFKREDYFSYKGLKGAKVRAALYLIHEAIALGFKKITTVGHRKSPQIHIVGEICKSLDLEFVGHTPQGELPKAFNQFTIIQHVAGYNNVLERRCKDFAKLNKFYDIPFGMISRDCMLLTANEFQNIPEEVKRIVIPVGSGVNLCGLLIAMRKQNKNIPIIGVVVGRSPLRILQQYAPYGWQGMVKLIDANVAYQKEAKITNFQGIELDPIYEAKCIPFIEEKDLFWIVGIRNFKE